MRRIVIVALLVVIPTIAVGLVIGTATVTPETWNGYSILALSNPCPKGYARDRKLGICIQTIPTVPTNTVAPTITGTAQAGYSLTSAYGTWAGTPTSYNIQWIWADNGLMIAGATASNYTPVASDVGHTLAVSIIASNGYGPSLPVSSIATVKVASVDGTTTPPAAQLVDLNNGVWTVSGGICYLNGTQAAGCSQVSLLLWYGQSIYVENNQTPALWWQWVSGAWVSIAGDPRGSGPSADGTTIPAAAGIVDGNGDKWTLSGSTCLRNGVTAGASCTASLILFSGNHIYIQNSAAAAPNQWSLWDFADTKWYGILGDPRGQDVLPGGATLTDAHGNAWQLIAGNSVQENGTDRGVTNIADMLLYNGVIFIHNTTNNWYGWNQTESKWVTVSQDPRTVTYWTLSKFKPNGANSATARGFNWCDDWSEGTIRAMQSLGANMCRLFVFLQPNSGTPSSITAYSYNGAVLYSGSYAQRIQPVLDQAAIYGVRVIITFDENPKNSGMFSIDNPSNYTAALASWNEILKDVAAKTLNNPWVIGLNTQNEPAPGGGTNTQPNIAAVNAGMQVTVNEIRKIDTTQKHPIFFDPAPLAAESSSFWINALPFDFNANGVIADFHPFADRATTLCGTSGSWPGPCTNHLFPSATYTTGMVASQNNFATIHNFQATNNISMIAGEWGCSNWVQNSTINGLPTCANWTNWMIQGLESYGFAWNYHAFRPANVSYGYSPDVDESLYCAYASTGGAACTYSGANGQPNINSSSSSTLWDQPVVVGSYNQSRNIKDPFGSPWSLYQQVRQCYTYSGSSWSSIICPGPGGMTLNEQYLSAAMANNTP